MNEDNADTMIRAMTSHSCTTSFFYSPIQDRHRHKGRPVTSFPIHLCTVILLHCGRISQIVHPCFVFHAIVIHEVALWLTPSHYLETWPLTFQSTQSNAVLSSKLLCSSVGRLWLLAYCLDQSDVTFLIECFSVLFVRGFSFSFSFCGKQQLNLVVSLHVCISLSIFYYIIKVAGGVIGGLGPRERVPGVGEREKSGPVVGQGTNV